MSSPAIQRRHSSARAAHATPDVDTFPPPPRRFAPPPAADVPSPAGEHVECAAERRLRELETEVAQLRTAMASRACIEQAKGVLMLLTNCGEQAAFDLLAHISSHTHRKVREVAVEIVESAAGRHGLPADIRAILQDACPPPSPPR